MPIQHVNDKILKRMNRHCTKEYLCNLIKKLRARIPGVVIRTSLITGLPGEDEAAFAELCDFLKEYKLERAGAFVFSPEEGTPAAKMEYPAREIAERRAEQVAEIESRVIDEYNESKLGTREKVLCEGWDEENGAYFGRSYAESFDVDGELWFRSEKPVEPGEFVTVEFDGTLDGELTGFVCEEE